MYKENLTLLEIETKEIDSILHNASQYYKLDKKRADAIRAFQKSTYLAFKPEEIQNNTTTYSDVEL